MRSLAPLLTLLVAVPALGADRGKVAYVTREAAYLDAGRGQGLTEGAVLSLWRQGRRVGECRIEALAEGHARCRGEGLLAGDRFALPPPPTPAPRRPVLAPAPVPGAAPGLLAEAMQPKVPFRGGRGPAPERLVVRGRAALTHASWVNASAAGYHLERLDVAAREVSVGALGLHASADASVQLWSSRPEAARLRPSDPLQLYVFETALTRRPAAGWVLALGRVRPYEAPGVQRLDGVQAGWRFGTAELGAYGGGLPTAVALVPGIDQWTAGAYWSHLVAAGPLFLRHAGRLSYSRLLLDPGRLDAEVRADARVGATWLGGQARVALAGERLGGPALDLGTLSLRTEPVVGLAFAGALRFVSPDAADPDGLRSPWRPEGTRHADAAVSWALSEAVQLSASVDWQSTLDHERLSVGPDLTLPRLLGSGVHLSLGYRESFGWFGGRDAWIQSFFSPWASTRLLVRVSWISTDFQATDAAPLHEGGAYAHLDSALLPWLDLRLSLLGRTDGRTGGGRAGVSLAGRL